MTYFIDTGAAIHLPQTNKLRGRQTASSVHGYRGRVLTRAGVLASDTALCDRCFPQRAAPPEGSAISARAARLHVTASGAA